LEALLDFPEEDVPDLNRIRPRERIEGVRSSIRNLLSTWEEGHMLRDGVLAVISGAPNVGKSTLLNALLGRDRAIVSDVPGTTRDSIEESVVIEGFLLRLVDTAGLRETDCAVEQHGVRRAQELVDRADLHLHVVDASSPLDTETRHLLDRLNTDNTIIIINKMDLCRGEPPEIDKRFTVVKTNMIGGCRVEGVRNAIGSALTKRSHGHHVATISERHRNLLADADSELAEAFRMLSEDQTGIVLVATRLRTALALIGQVIGVNLDDAVLSSIFSRFCIGK
jgi:tRNA modification GTPase